MNSQESLYVNSLDVSGRDRYENKLEYGDSTDLLPDPYFMQDGWQNDSGSNSNVPRRYLQLAVTITLSTRHESSGEPR